MRSRNLKESFTYAWSGVVYAFTSQRNMKIHAAAGLTTVILGLVLQISRLEWGLLMLTVFQVIVAETVNTAVEKAVDLFSDGFHPLAEIAKNVAAGAVLLASLAAVIIGIIIFGSKIIDHLV